MLSRNTRNSIQRQGKYRGSCCLFGQTTWH